jgi:hypothetical protein
VLHSQCGDRNGCERRGTILRCPANHRFRGSPIALVIPDAITTYSPRQDFRTEEGAQANTSKTVTHSLSDFIPSSILGTDESAAHPTTSIPFTQLFGWLEVAEARRRVAESKTGEGLKRLTAGVVLRKGATSPEEMLAQERRGDF